MSEVDVLVVDDDEAIAEFVAVLLSDRGYKVKVALDGEEGLDLLRTIKPRLLLLDLTLPRMDGWQMVQAIRASGGLSELPIVVMSAHPDVREEAESMGVRYIKKPFDLDELFSCVAIYAGSRG